MADVQKPKKGDGGQAASEAGRATADAGARVIDMGARQAEEGARAAEAVVEKTADASRAAAKANTEILQTQIETAQEVVHSGLETGVRTFEGLAQNWRRAFGVATPNSDLAEQSAQNVQAVARASSVLARGAQDASRAWFELTQRTMRTNLEALSQLASCRSVQEVVIVQTNLLRDNLRQAVESSEAIARSSSDAIREASQVMQSQAQPRR